MKSVISVWNGNDRCMGIKGAMGKCWPWLSTTVLPCQPPSFAARACVGEKVHRRREDIRPRARDGQHKGWSGTIFFSIASKSKLNMFTFEFSRFELQDSFHSRLWPQKAGVIICQGQSPHISVITGVNP